MVRAWEKAKGCRAEMRMTVLGSLASASRISLETEAVSRRVWWEACSIRWRSMWVVSSSAWSPPEMQTRAKPWMIRRFEQQTLPLAIVIDAPLVLPAIYAVSTDEESKSSPF